MKTSKNARRLFSTRDNHALSDVGHLMEPVARRLLGEPNSKLSKPPRELRFGNHGSLSVDLTRACFFDHERGVGGGVLDLIKHKLGCDHAGAVSYLRSQNFLNLLRPTSRRRIPAPRPGAHSDHIDHTPRALDIWREAGDPRGTLVEQYLVSERGLQLADDIAGDVIRFHPALYYEGTRVGGMVALFRDIVTNEISTFESRWTIGTKQRLAFALTLYSGQRRSDVHRMTWADVKKNGIDVVQQKTGRKLLIPIHPELCAILANAKREHVTIINTEYGQPFTVDGFSQWFRNAITAAGLPLDCQPHGLRKAAGRRLAEAGCTAHQIMAVLGHKTLADAERYTREADQAQLAMEAKA
jgi:integrase